MDRRSPGWQELPRRVAGPAFPQPGMDGPPVMVPHPGTFAAAGHDAQPQTGPPIPSPRWPGPSTRLGRRRSPGPSPPFPRTRRLRRTIRLRPYQPVRRIGPAAAPAYRAGSGLSRAARGGAGPAEGGFPAEGGYAAGGGYAGELWLSGGGSRRRRLPGIRRILAIPGGSCLPGGSWLRRDDPARRADEPSRRTRVYEPVLSTPAGHELALSARGYEPVPQVYGADRW